MRQEISVLFSMINASSSPPNAYFTRLCKRVNQPPYRCGFVSRGGTSGCSTSGAYFMDIYSLRPFLPQYKFISPTLNGHFQLVPAFHKLALCALPAKALPTSLYTANDYDSQARVDPDRYGFALTIVLPGHPPGRYIYASIDTEARLLLHIELRL